MDFSYSEEQSLLHDAVRRFVDGEYAFDKRRAYGASPEGFSRRNWRLMADMGLLGLPFEEAYGGSGRTAVELMIVMEEFGRGLVVEPYLASVVLGGGLVAEAGSEAQKRAILPPLIAGRSLLAFAYGEPQARYTASDIETRATRRGGEFILEGRKSVVLSGECADLLAISARTGGGPREPGGITLFLVGPDAAGLRRRGYATIDGRRGADLVLDGVRVGEDAVLGPIDGALPAIERTIDRAIAAVCAEATGIMGALNELTLDYLKTRRQFGSPIGKFQALQHRMVDMRIAFERAKSMACLAAMAAGEAEADARRRSVSAAKVQIAKSGRFIGEQSIQLHGGIGMTDEYQAGHYFKRLTMISSLFGDADHHLGRFVEPGARHAPDIE
ncbi:MAG: acyl-CoA dehydrogenase family protein [Pseudomonadota bacterium]